MSEDVKLAVITCNFADYPRDEVERLIDVSMETIEKAGVNVSCRAKIFDMDDARKASKDWATKEFDGIIVLVASWFESPQLMEVIRPYLSKPILLWGLSAYNKEGVFVSSGSIAAYSAVAQPLSAMGARFKKVYASPHSPKIDKELKSFSSVVKAVKSLGNSIVGMMGYGDMGLYNLAFDAVSLRKKIGPEVSEFGMNELFKYMDAVDEAAIQSKIKEMEENWKFHDAPTEEAMRTCARMYLALRSISRERHYNALTLKCVHGLREHLGFTACTPMSMLGDEIDYVCECDVLGAVTQLALRYLTDATTTFVEMYDIMSDRILVGVCGFVPFGMVEGPIDITATSWGGFTGFFNTSKMKTGRVTLARLTHIEGKYTMHIVTGMAEQPRKWIELGWPFPDNAYPSLEIILDGSVEDFDKALSAQHFGLSYGDCKQELQDLCQLLGIEAVVS